MPFLSTIKLGDETNIIKRIFHALYYPSSLNHHSKMENNSTIDDERLFFKSYDRMIAVINLIGRSSHGINFSLDVIIDSFQK